MIHTATDFYNKVAMEVRGRYFPNENHGQSTNTNYFGALKAIEDFNNGALTYRQLINRTAKNCFDTNYNIDKLMTKYIVSFGKYNYKTKTI